MERSAPRHRVDVDEYYRMAEEGRFSRDARTELINGAIIEMPPIGSLHAGTVNALMHLFVLAVNRQAWVIAQSPVRLDRFSEPQPDIALLQVRADSYTQSHPTPSETLLIVEVSDSSLRYDRNTKLPLYAQHGIPEVWIVNLKSRRLQSFRSPLQGRYTEVITFTEQDQVSPLQLPAVRIELSQLLRAARTQPRDSQPLA